MAMQHHATKTYRGKPACIGSGDLPGRLGKYGSFFCAACGKEVSGTLPKSGPRMVNTHLAARR